MNVERKLKRAADEARQSYANAPIATFRGRKKVRTAMTGAVGIASIAAVVLAISSLTTRPEQNPEATPSVASTTTSTAMDQIEPTPPGQQGPLSSDVIEGHLPDGTPFLIRADASMAARAEGVSVTIFFKSIDGNLIDVGNSTISPQVDAIEPSLVSGNLRVPAGSWLLEIEVDQAILASLGSEAETVLTQSVHGREEGGLPVFDLTDPLTFGDGQPLIEVRYPGFAVSPGCEEETDTVCSPTRSVQVTPFPIDSSLPDSLRIESPAPRPPTDSYYLDPGPLSVRGGHSVFWTGSQMLVWGGTSQEGSGPLVDGALYDPATSTWQMLPSAPITPQPTVAAWSGERLYVAGATGAAAWSPEDGWQSMSPPGLQVNSNSVALWAGESLFIWSDEDFVRFNQGVGSWEPLSAPPFGHPERSLVDAEGTLLATAFNEDDCSNLQIGIRSDKNWQPIPAPGQNDSCILPQTTALLERRLIAWDVATENTSSYEIDGDAGWVPMADNPLEPCNAWISPIAVANRLVVFNLCDRDAAILDTSQSTWKEARAPGPIGNGHAVWTGNEILMWGASCCFGTGSSFESIDAWRWTP